MRNSTLLTLSAICFSTGASATHLCGGELRYSHIEGLTYQLEVRFYLDSGSPGDVTDGILSYGDGSVDTIPSASDLALGSDCCDRLRTYIGQHTYPAPGAYHPSVIALNRKAGVVNIPGSLDVPMCIRAMLLVSPSLTNRSPEFTNHAIFSYFNGSVLTHELQPFDADGDSLSFMIIEPEGEDCASVPGYQFPNEVVPGPYTISVSSDGVFQWNSPQLAGLYTIAIRCTEWRDGAVIGEVDRDMILCVSPLLTAIPDASATKLLITQGSLDGTVSLHTGSCMGCRVDILDARGALVRQLVTTGSRSLIATDAMTPGVYLVKLTDAEGSIDAGRLVVAR